MEYITIRPFEIKNSDKIDEQIHLQKNGILILPGRLFSKGMSRVLLFRCWIFGGHCNLIENHHLILLKFPIFYLFSYLNNI